MLEYCYPVWMSAAASNLGHLDRVVLEAVRLIDGFVVCDLEHRRRVAALCTFNKIYCNPNHASEAALRRVHVPTRLTCLAISS